MSLLFRLVSVSIACCCCVLPTTVLCISRANVERERVNGKQVLAIITAGIVEIFVVIVVVLAMVGC